MNKDNIRRNYVVPLGTQRGPLTREPDEIWKWLYAQRVAHGLSTLDVEKLTGVSQSTVCKGERGGLVSLQLTQRLLELYGRKLIMADLDVDE